jgi:hypothetical protein
MMYDTGGTAAGRFPDKIDPLKLPRRVENEEEGKKEVGGGRSAPCGLRLLLTATIL